MFFFTNNYILERSEVLITDTRGHKKQNWVLNHLKIFGIGENFKIRIKAISSVYVRKMIIVVVLYRSYLKKLIHLLFGVVVDGVDGGVTGVPVVA
ncbi:hypothetical protein C5167_040646 [Papaver somniferum]|uniref:Uncharacterized protein n=1 Tax=Papaver somniferum TaxID=3469 RepID=A0A4Y7IHW1_PAPSO|nr:hypothetical protein C5167_040646 [Papaver somniferum]